ncbi:TPA: acyltransferase [Kluyvera ascorbata F0526]|nr:acyltransferase [Kluyvera ascorbata F0526]
MKNNNKILNIEALRGAAIILVLMAHSFFVPIISKIQHFFDFGRGVDVFFIISGFLMGSTYISKLDLSKFNLLLAYNFYAKRFLRLFPAMVFWCAVILIFEKYWINIGIFSSISDVIRFISSNLIFMGNFFNNNHQNALGYWWSLGLEGQFYIILPIIVYLSGSWFWKVIVAIPLILSFSSIWSFDYFWMFRIHSLFIGLIAWKISQASVFTLMSNKLNALPNLQLNLIVLFLFFSGILIPTSILSAQPFVSLVVGIIFGLALLLSLCMKNALFGYFNFIFVFSEEYLILYTYHTWLYSI